MPAILLRSSPPPTGRLGAATIAEGAGVRQTKKENDRGAKSVRRGRFPLGSGPVSPVETGVPEQGGAFRWHGPSPRHGSPGEGSLDDVTGSPSACRPS